MRPLLACLLIVLAMPAGAQIYKYTDSNGNTVFTNQPPDGAPAESVTLPPTNTVEMKFPNIPPAPPQPDTQNSRPYTVLSLNGIPTDEAKRANNGTFSVGVDIEPRLQPGHFLRLRLDGEPYGQPSNVPTLQITNLSRGEHNLAVEVLQGNRVIQASASITFTLQRTSVNNPARQPAPAPPPSPKPAS